MPPPPDTSAFSHYLFENPWPLAVGLLAVAITIAVTAARRGAWRRLVWAGAAGVAAVVVMMLGVLITTPAEHGERVAARFISAIEAGDAAAAVDTLAPGVTVHLARPTNPAAMEADDVRRRVRSFIDRYTIDANTVRSLDGYTTAPHTATVHLGMFTELAFPGTAITKWVIHTRRDAEDDERWVIDRLTLVEVNTQTPTAHMLRR